jgi:choice-of-anchor C domain-containing protein
MISRRSFVPAIRLGRTILAVAAAALCVLAGPVVSAASVSEPAKLLHDGDFKHPVAPVNSFLTFFAPHVFSGWHVIGSIDIVASGFWPAAHGDQSVDLNGASAGGIWRSVRTQPGHRYDLSFQFAGNPDTVCGPQGIKTLVLSAGDTTRTFTFDTTGHTLQDIGWVSRHVHFTATGSKTQIVFRSESGSCAGPTIDFVRMAPLAGLLKS